MTAQEIFDKVLTAIRVQGKPARGPGGQCMYRTNDGSKCAVGHLIPDDFPGLPGLCANNPSAFAIPPFMLAELGLEEHRDLLQDLQDAHDSGYVAGFTDSFESSMCVVAVKHGLDYTSP